MKKIIYLDYNIIIFLMNKNKIKLNITINKCSRKYKFVYSPAHIEEIATPIMKGKVSEKITMKKLSFLKNLTKKNELLPPTTGLPRKGTIKLVKEAPLVCYKRVIDQYHKNPIMEKLEEELLKKYKEADPKGELSGKISNYGEDLLSMPEFKDDLEKRFRSDDFLIQFFENERKNINNQYFKENLFKYNHDIYERVMELTLNYLELIRYKPEKIKKHRSRMHDTTHSIYGAYSDIFVTDDRRFLAKLKAVYNYFSINTKVLHTDEFINQYL